MKKMKTHQGSNRREEHAKTYLSEFLLASLAVRHFYIDHFLVDPHVDLFMEQVW